MRKKGTRGAISVFLVIILVPCIAFTSVFIDLGRVRLAKAVAESASDLALNNLIANYDADLAEWYGVIASCQSIDSFYEESAKLFLRVLKSQDLDRDEYYSIIDYVVGATGNDKIYDLLSMEVQTDAGEIVKQTPFGEGEAGNTDDSLAQPTLMKDAIVEFMKYRGPIEIATSLINRINNDPSTEGTIQADINKPLCEDKTDFYTAEGELLAAAFNTYRTLLEYFKEDTKLGINNDKLYNFEQKICSYKDVYKQIHEKMVKNLFNTEGLHWYSRTTSKLDKFNDVYSPENTDDPNKFAEVYTRKESGDGGDVYYIDDVQIDALLQACETAANEFKAAIDNCGNDEKVKALADMTVSDDGSDFAYPIQWWKQMQDALYDQSSYEGAMNSHVAKIADKCEKMLIAYSKVNAIGFCTYDGEGDAIPQDKQTAITASMDVVKKLQEKYLTDGVENDSDPYLKAINKIERISWNNKDNIVASNLKVTVDGTQMSIPSAITHMKDELTKIKDDLNKLIDLLDIAINGNEGDKDVPKEKQVKSLDKLYDLAQEYKRTLNAWSNEAFSNDNKMHTDDQQQINELQEDAADNITGERVTELKNRLTNVKAQFECIVTAIDGFCYGGESLANIGDFSTFKAKASTKVSASEIKLKNGELDSYCNSTFAELLTPQEDPVVHVEHIGDFNYNPTMDPNSGDVHTPELFMYFHERFEGVDEGEVDKANKEKDEAKDAAEDKKDEIKNKGRYHGGGQKIEHEYADSSAFSLADGAISGIVDLIKCLVNLNFTSIRDDLYVTTYIMNMFTYATYEEEGIYGLFDSETQKSFTLPMSGYRPSKYDDMIGSDAEDADNSGKWLSTNPEDHYNKSLTNKMRNKDNQVAYCAEVEYILIGNHDNNENVKEIYSKLFGIRYALNFVSAFQHFWSMNTDTGRVINSVAGLVQSLTMGIVPAPVVKVILLPILALIETALDLDRLEAGFPVELYKMEPGQWWASLEDGPEGIGAVVNALFNGNFGKPNKGEGIFYSDYLTFFVYLGLKSGSGGAMYQRMAEVIQTNMREHVSAEGYSLTKSKLYFNLEAEVRVRPLMISLPIFREYEDDKPKNTDWCTFKIKTTRGYS